MILVRACAIVVLFIRKPPSLTQARTRMVQVWYKDETIELDYKGCFQVRLKIPFVPGMVKEQPQFFKSPFHFPQKRVFGNYFYIVH